MHTVFYSITNDEGGDDLFNISHVILFIYFNFEDNDGVTRVFQGSCRYLVTIKMQFAIMSLPHADIHPVGSKGRCWSSKNNSELCFRPPCSVQSGYAFDSEQQLGGCRLGCIFSTTRDRRSKYFYYCSYYYKLDLYYVVAHLRVF